MAGLAAGGHDGHDRLVGCPGRLAGTPDRRRPAGPQTARFNVDINAADWPELAQVPGIGQTLAQRIVACRSAEGPFIDHDDLRRRVRGIGPRTLKNRRALLPPMPPAADLAGKLSLTARAELPLRVACPGQ